MALKQIDHGTPEYEQMIALRHQLLRQPIGLEFSVEELQKEKSDILIASIDHERMLGCCILSPVEQGVVRLRQMAVLKPFQGKGVGESILHFTENIARDKGFAKITMHARNSAIGFYERFGYQLVGDEFMEVGLPHHHMEKLIL